MNEEERKELRKYLDGMFFATDKQKRSVIAENYLEKMWSQQQKDDLYQAIQKLKNANILPGDPNQEAQVLDDALDIVENILKTIDFHGMQSGKKKKTDLVPRDKMPFLIKQVLWLVCYKALCGGLKQKTVFGEIKYKHNIPISQNFFSNEIELSPVYYLQCERYLQPENPCKYKGQKEGELGEAIKYLVYQAGVHTCFVDLFGGSGSASAAVCHKKRVKYVYNEKNKRVCNYMRVISGDKYKDLIQCMEQIQEDLRSSKLSPKSFFGFDIQEEIKTYIQNKLNKGNKKIDKDVVEDEKKILDFGTEKYKFEVESVKRQVKYFVKTVQEDAPRHIGNNTERQRKYKGLEKLSETSVLSNARVKNSELQKYLDEWMELCQECSVFAIYPAWIYMYLTNNPSVKISYEEYIRKLRQYKALGYYAYFMNLVSPSEELQQEDAVKYAAGEIYLHYFAIRGTILSSAIRDYEFLKPHSERNIYKGRKPSLYNFIYYENYKDLITKFHDSLCGSGGNWSVENQGFQKIPLRYQDNKILFYSDSPYLGTSDYVDEKNGVDPFTVEDMEELINLLMEQEVGKGKKYAKFKNKFIFSMRAVKTKEKDGNQNKRLKANKAICTNVYKRFLEKKNNHTLYVLVIYEKGKNLCKLLQESKVVEIMITNYKIVSFEAEGSGKKRYVCEALVFDDYLKLIKANMEGYQKSWGL